MFLLEGFGLAGWGFNERLGLHWAWRVQGRSGDSGLICLSAFEPRVEVVGHVSSVEASGVMALAFQHEEGHATR